MTGVQTCALPIGIEHINDMNTQIASAAEEQSAVAEEVNQSVIKISQIAETSTANSAQTQNSSEELSRLSDRKSVV